MLMEAVNSPFFGYGCTIVAFFLYRTSKLEYRFCLAVMFYEFLFCNLFSLVGLELSRMWAQWQIYALYGVVQLVAMGALFFYQYQKVSISVSIAVLIGLAGLINVELALSWNNQGLTPFTAMQIYNIYPFLFAFIMVLQLFFMLICNKSILERIFKNGGANNDIIDRVFFVYPRTTNRDIGRSMV